MGTKMIVIDYERKADADDSKFKVEIEGRLYNSVSGHSAYRLIRWIHSHRTGVFGGANYYGGHYKVLHKSTKTVLTVAN